MAATTDLFAGIALESWEEYIHLQELDDDEVEDTVLALAPTHIQVITFCLGHEIYGIDILKVRELITYTPCTPIPNMPPFIKGMVNLRGLVIPVMDLRLRFAIGTPVYHRYTVIIVVQVEGRLSGLIVDAVADVVAVAREAIQSPPENLAAVDLSFIAGVVNMRDSMVILLNPERLLARETLLLAPGLEAPHA